MNSHRPIVPLVGALLALSLSSAQVARAADAPGKKDAAEKLFVEGQEAMTRGEQALACAKFRSSVELFPVPNALANVARCAERDGRIVEALRAWEQVLTMLPAADPRLDPARERIAALAAKVEALGPQEPRSPIAPIAPIEADRKDLVVHAGPAPIAPIAPVEPPSNRLRTAAFAAGGVGVAGFVVAGITGGILLGRDAEIKNSCPIPKLCNDAVLQEIAGSKPLLIANAVAWGFGLAGVGASAVLFLTSRGRAAPATTVVPVVTSSSAGLVLGGKF